MSAPSVLHIPSSPRLTRFLTRTHSYALSLQPTSSLSPRPLPAPNPFIPIYNETTGCWAPPRYSRRRQRVLLKEAEKAGVRGWMPAGVGEKRPRAEAGYKVKAQVPEPVVQVETAAEKGGEEGEKLEVEVPGSSTVMDVPPIPASPPTPSAAATIASSSLPPTPDSTPTPRRVRTPPTPLPLTSPTQPFQWLGIPTPRPAHSTVYGRRVNDKEDWFRGHKWERLRDERKKEVGERLESMQDRVKDWRKTRWDTRKKGM